MRLRICLEQDTLQPKADQAAEEGIKPAGKATKDAVQKAQDQIPEPETSRKVAEENVSKAAKPAAQAVKDNAQPLADKACLCLLHTTSSHRRQQYLASQTFKCTRHAY